MTPSPVHMCQSQSITGLTCQPRESANQYQPASLSSRPPRPYDPWISMSAICLAACAWRP
jgi:hypothetical protein